VKRIRLEVLDFAGGYQEDLRMNCLTEIWKYGQGQKSQGIISSTSSSFQFHSLSFCISKIKLRFALSGPQPKFRKLLAGEVFSDFF